MRQSGRTRRRQGNPGFITRRIVCEESIPATEIGSAYEAPVPDSLPAKKRCQRRPIVRSSRLLQVKWKSWQSNSLGTILIAPSRQTSAGVMNSRANGGYSILEDQHSE